MPVTIIHGTNRKPGSSEALSNFFENHQEFDGQLFLGYPIIGSAEGKFAIDAIWITPMKGIILFDLVEGKDIDNYGERQDEAANLLEAKLKMHRELVAKRKLITPIHTITFAPGISHAEGEDYYFVANFENLDEVIDSVEDWVAKDENIFNKTLSAIQNISTIRKSRFARKVEKLDSRGAKLKKIEDSISTLDAQQGRAVVETVEGVQRIRGLAGSGKTIVLALKAAYLHAQHPEWFIAVTFNTRSLKEQFERLINTFCIEQTGEEPDWENIRVINAWGASGGKARDGIYHQFCQINDIPYYDFKSARVKFGQGKEFAGACQEALDLVKKPSCYYDAILVDEAQDFDPSFLKLCYEFLKENKNLVYAYDELQKLSGESLPGPEEIFGKDYNGEPRVQFRAPEEGKPRADILLDKCYRNSRPILTTAHALGFGIYRPAPKKEQTGLVQMFDQPGLWEDVGYRVKSGELMEGSYVVLERTDETSPKFLENHSEIEDLVQFRKFDSEEEQTTWVANEIQKNLKNDELRHEDIIVINPEPIKTREKVGPIRKVLYKNEINSHLAGVDTISDVFFQPSQQSVTFSGIYRAKGNEAGMVYIINAQDCHSSAFNLARIRNRLFTAITRSKAWVRVLGVGRLMDELMHEFYSLKDANFELRFKYPTEEERNKLSIIHRDMSHEERKKFDESKKGLNQVLKALESGAINREDLDEDMLEKLRELLFEDK